eukprot:1354417-Lingulodinium_polyedra.AAC.1
MEVGDSHVDWVKDLKGELWHLRVPGREAHGREEEAEGQEEEEEGYDSFCGSEEEEEEEQEEEESGTDYETDGSRGRGGGT